MIDARERREIEKLNRKSGKKMNPNSPVAKSNRYDLLPGLFADRTPIISETEMQLLKFQDLEVGSLKLGSKVPNSPFLALLAPLFLSYILKEQIDPDPDSGSDSASASATANLLVGEYEVFLSFCGQDTRYGFTDFLYTSLQGAGIRTFRDNENLHVGKEIGPELLKAITDSQISIPIFSKNYASSKWCLLELEQMVQCHAEGGQIIFPIFFDVEPSDVRHQNGSYEEAFRQYRKKRLDEKTIRGWKRALTKVGQLKGLELKKETGRHEGELVKIIRDKVLEFLKQNHKHEDMDLGTENVKALCLDFEDFELRQGWEYGYPRLVGQKFLNLRNLRYLTLNGADLDGDFEHCLPNLRWLQWRHCLVTFTPTNFRLRNLVVLDLSRSDITDDWDLWNQIKVLLFSCFSGLIIIYLP
ncbi:hypothetical protein LguiB_010688 [Lonicera macranthoides]